MYDHEFWMRRALQLAEQAAALGEVPVAAILVKDDEVIGQGFNQPISSHDPTAHAEISAIRSAATKMQNYRLPDTTLYVTLEPCTMCLGAVIHSRISNLVFGAREPKAGAVVSADPLAGKSFFNHQLSVHEGVLAEECSSMLSAFFRQRRLAKKQLREQQRNPDA